MRFLSLAGFSMVLVLGGCGSSSAGDERVCDSTDPECSCQALSDGWCIVYHNDAGELDEGVCASFGGEEVKELCPTESEVARCHEIDDCHSPTYIFYDNYQGGFDDYATVDDLETACNDGELVGSTCAEWVTP